MACFEKGEKREKKDQKEKAWSKTGRNKMTGFGGGED